MIDVSTYKFPFGKKIMRVFLGINTQGRLVMKAFLTSPWVLLTHSKKRLKAIAGITNAIYGVGLDNWVYRYGGGNSWVRLPRTCCVMDIHVMDDSQHTVYGMFTSIFIWPVFQTT